MKNNLRFLLKVLGQSMLVSFVLSIVFSFLLEVVHDAHAHSVVPTWIILFLTAWPGGVITACITGLVLLFKKQLNIRPALYAAALGTCAISIALLINLAN